MDTLQAKTKVKEKLLALITEGSSLRDKTNSEYYAKRESETFDREKDTVEWENLFTDWYRGAISDLDNLFDPSIIVINRFKNPNIDGVYPVGQI